MRFYEAAAWRRLARWGVHRGPSFFVRFVPPVIGYWFAFILPGMRKVVLRNLRRIFGKRDAWQEARDVVDTFGQFASCFAESLGPERPEAHAGRTRVRGGQRLLECLSAGRGVVLVTAHVGPWDGAARVLSSQQDVPVMLVMGQEETAAASLVQDRARLHARVQVLRLGPHPLDALPILQHLDNGGVVALQLDRAPSGRPAIVGRLFGRPFAAPTGPFVLAGMAGAAVLPVFSARTGFYRRMIDVGQPLWPARRSSAEELRSYVDRSLQQLEGHLLRFPTQWFHFTSDEQERRSIELAARAPSARHARSRGPSSA